MIEVKKEGILLNKTDLDFENEGVLNPAAIRVGNEVHMYYRAVSKGNFSTIGYCRLNGPTTVIERHEVPLVKPEFEYELQGLEDARIVNIDGLYYLSYTAYDGISALGALATSTNLLDFEKKGIIVPQLTYEEFKQLAGTRKDLNEKYFRYYKLEYIFKRLNQRVYLWDKNVIFFPRRIHGNLVFLHRIKPGIQLVMVKELEELTPKYWEDYIKNLPDHIVMESQYLHEYSYIGGGCPPIETEHGWLLIYHSVEDTPVGYVYSACAALLDLNDPLKVISRLPYALFSPEFDWELCGEVNNVVFPTGAVVFDGRLYIYYGAADERIATASINFNDLVNELLNNKKNENL